MELLYFISGTLFITLFKIILLIIVIKVVTEKIHWSAYLILTGLILNIIFPILQQIIIFNLNKSISSGALLSSEKTFIVSSIMAGIGLFGFVLEIIGLSIFLLYVLKIHKENKELKIDNICKDTTESY